MLDLITRQTAGKIRGKARTDAADYYSVWKLATVTEDKAPDHDVVTGTNKGACA